MAGIDTVKQQIKVKIERQLLNRVLSSTILSTHIDCSNNMLANQLSGSIVTEEVVLVESSCVPLRCTNCNVVQAIA